MSTSIDTPAGAAAAAPAGTTQLVVFDLGTDVYGIPIGAVQEIIRHTTPRPVPGSAPGVEGLINLRGRIIPVLDLRAKLTATGERPAEGDIVIVALPDAVLGLQVDEVREVMTVTRELVEPPPAGLGTDGSVSGIAKLDGRLLVVLDPVSLLGAGRRE